MNELKVLEDYYNDRLNIYLKIKKELPGLEVAIKILKNTENNFGRTLKAALSSGPIKDTFGHKIKLARGHAKITQAQLALKLGITAATLSGIELNRGIKYPSRIRYELQNFILTHGKTK